MMIFNINKINKPKKVQINNEECWEIIYKYSIFVEKAFSQYINDSFHSNNSSREYEYKKTIYVNDNGRIINELKKELERDITWGN